jgi:hypothetical protein
MLSLPIPGTTSYQRHNSCGYPILCRFVCSPQGHIWMHLPALLDLTKPVLHGRTTWSSTASLSRSPRFAPVSFDQLSSALLTLLGELKIHHCSHTLARGRRAASDHKPGAWALTQRVHAIFCHGIRILYSRLHMGCKPAISQESVVMAERESYK